MNPLIFAESAYAIPLLLVAAGAFGLARRMTRRGELTYEEALAYFVKHRPNDERVVRGAILLERSPASVTVRWLFLDHNDEPVADSRGMPYGQSRRYAALSKELLDDFRGTDLLLVS